MLARVITELGSLPPVTPNDVEGFFAADLAFLQDLYGIINFGDPADVEALQATGRPSTSLPGTANPSTTSGQPTAAAEPATTERSDPFAAPPGAHRGGPEPIVVVRSDDEAVSRAVAVE